MTDKKLLEGLAKTSRFEHDGISADAKYVAETLRQVLPISGQNTVSFEEFTIAPGAVEEIEIRNYDELFVQFVNGNSEVRLRINGQQNDILTDAQVFPGQTVSFTPPVSIAFNNAGGVNAGVGILLSKSLELDVPNPVMLANADEVGTPFERLMSHERALMTRPRLAPNTWTVNTRAVGSTGGLIIQHTAAAGRVPRVTDVQLVHVSGSGGTEARWEVGGTTLWNLFARATSPQHAHFDNWNPLRQNAGVASLSITVIVITGAAVTWDIITRGYDAPTPALGPL